MHNLYQVVTQKQKVEHFFYVPPSKCMLNHLFYRLINPLSMQKYIFAQLPNIAETFRPYFSKCFVSLRFSLVCLSKK